MSSNLSSLYFTSHQFLPIHFSTSASARDRWCHTLCFGGHLKAHERVTSQPPNKDDTTKMVHPTASGLYANHFTSEDASAIAFHFLQQRLPHSKFGNNLHSSTVSDINNVFSSLLVIFTSSFVTPHVKSHECIQKGVFFPTTLCNHQRYREGGSETNVISGRSTNNNPFSLIRQ